MADQFDADLNPITPDEVPSTGTWFEREIDV
jgi:hypothetical protein